MSEINLEELAGNLSKAQKRVMMADDFPKALAEVHPQAFEALQRKGIVPEGTVQGTLGTLVLTELGVSLMGYLRSGGSQKPVVEENSLEHGSCAEGAEPATTGGGEAASSPSEEDLEQSLHAARETFLDRMATIPHVLSHLPAETDTDVPSVDMRELTEDDIARDPVLDFAYDEINTAGDWAIMPIMDEQSVLTGALDAANVATHELMQLEDIYVAHIIDSFTGDTLAHAFAQQYAAEAAMAPETLFRMIVPNAGAHWDNCPRWLNVWLTVFASVTMALKPLVIAERADLAARVDALLRENWSAKGRQRHAAKIEAKRTRRKEKHGRMKAAKAIREGEA